MFLIDTNVISEARKQGKAHPGVQAFFKELSQSQEPAFLSVVTVGELRRGVEMIRQRGDGHQADLLERWLNALLQQFEHLILPFDLDAAQVWGSLRAAQPAHELDKQIAATALIHDLTVVTRNAADFANTGVRLRNPFLEA